MSMMYITYIIIQKQVVSLFTPLGISMFLPPNDFHLIMAGKASTCYRFSTVTSSRKASTFPKPAALSWICHGYNEERSAIKYIIFQYVDKYNKSILRLSLIVTIMTNTLVNISINIMYTYIPDTLRYVNIYTAWVSISSKDRLRRWLLSRPAAANGCKQRCNANQFSPFIYCMYLNRYIYISIHYM